VCRFSPASMSLRPELDGQIDVSDQTSFACDLYRAVAEHFHRITALTGQVSKYSDHRSFGVVAERLVDLVTNYKFCSHRESSNPSAARLCSALRPK
jgi:hypothetical protein